MPGDRLFENRQWNRQVRLNFSDCVRRAFIVHNECVSTTQFCQICIEQSTGAVVQLNDHVIDDLRMLFWYKVFGEAPAERRSLFISMHGGEGAPKEVNDQRYENQKRLYQPEEGVYLVPRAATNTWDLWYQSHIDIFLERLITDMILFEDVNPDRVCIMGYSAGGDGVCQLAPRMADRLATAGDRTLASVNENEISIEHCDSKTITILLSDNMLDLDKSVSVRLPSGATSRHAVKRTITDIEASLANRFDKAATFSATIQIPIGESE